MIYVISKETCGEYAVRDIQTNSCWCSCVLEGYALIPDELVSGILATRGYCDITLNDEGTEVVSFTAREIPQVQIVPVPSIILTENADYGDTFPTNPKKGQLFFAPDVLPDISDQVSIVLDSVNDPRGELTFDAFNGTTINVEQFRYLPAGNIVFCCVSLSLVCTQNATAGVILGGSITLPPEYLPITGCAGEAISPDETLSIKLAIDEVGVVQVYLFDTTNRYSSRTQHFNFFYFCEGTGGIG